ncbi:MAG TPA: FtsQ-type POTRA domain-containing protein [Anaerolineae bacterium]|nr:FtsQ-type POTRA domain-containing protein [Anaerolineae bacterium]
MAARKATPTGRRKDAQQDFLSRPPKRRRRLARREHHQEQALLPDVRTTSKRSAVGAGSPRPRLAHLPVLRGVASILFVGLAALLVFLFSDTRFYVQTAAIRGLHYTNAEQVYHQAGIDQYSIFWLNDKEAEQRIETLPYVKQATVHTALPNQVRIEVVEREPLVVWKVGGQEHWVDSEGITMPVASLGTTQDLPVLWDLNGSTVAGDGRLDPQLIASLRQVKQQMSEVTDFGYDRVNGLQFRFPGGAFVYLGHPEGMAKRVASLLVLHRSLASQGQEPAEINWRFENGYYLRLAP